MKRWSLRTAIAGALVAAPRAALACPVCFGQSDSPLASAMNMGILLMLGVVAAILSAFGAFFIYLNRRARLIESGALDAGASRPSVSDYSGNDPQEGTAQC